MEDEIRVFQLISDYKYKRKDEVMVLIFAGTDFYGGKASPFPSLREYATTWGGVRYWFDSRFVEESGLFKELYV